MKNTPFGVELLNRLIQNSKTKTIHQIHGQNAKKNPSKTDECPLDLLLMNRHFLSNHLSSISGQIKRFYPLTTILKFKDTTQHHRTNKQFIVNIAGFTSNS